MAHSCPECYETCYCGGDMADPPEPLYEDCYEADTGGRLMPMPNNWPEGIPFLDENVAWRGVSSLRNLNVERLEELARDKMATVIHENGRPLSVMLPWEIFLAIQEAARRFPQEAIVRGEGHT